jgi:hypothetical protein
MLFCMSASDKNFDISAAAALQAIRSFAGNKMM